MRGWSVLGSVPLMGSGTNIPRKKIGEHFLCSIVIVVPHEERALGDNTSKSCRRKALVAADSTCQSRSRGPKEPVVDDG